MTTRVTITDKIHFFHNTRATEGIHRNGCVFNYTFQTTGTSGVGCGMMSPTVGQETIFVVSSHIILNQE